MRRQGSKPRGFSLIEAAVAIAIIAILASAAAPLVMKALNQQREQKTRESLKIAFEAMFGARDRRVANMRADYGFNPGGMADLRQMTTRTPGAMRNWSSDVAVGGMSWGWNGPYWTGSVQAAAGTLGVPVDGWGRPLRLIFNNGWQLQSSGPNGVFGGVVNDDISYPASPAPVSNYQSTLTINVQRTNPASVAAAPDITIVITDRNDGSTHRAPDPTPTGPPSPPPYYKVLPYTMPLNDKQSWTYTVTSGPVRVVVNGTIQILDLLPGESRTLDYKYD